MGIPRVVAIVSLSHPQHQVTPHVSLLPGALAMGHSHPMANEVNRAGAIRPACWGRSQRWELLRQVVGGHRRRRGAESARRARDLAVGDPQIASTSTASCVVFGGTLSASPEFTSALGEFYQSD